MFLFAFDERGTKSYNPEKDDYFIYGGYGIRTSKINQLKENWQRCKIGLCGSSKIELKWRDFFSKKANIYLSEELRNDTQNGAIIYNFFYDRRIPPNYLFPINLIIHKSQIQEYGYIEASTGNLKLNVDTLYMVLFGLINRLMLEEKDNVKSIIFDFLSSDKENQKRIDDYHRILKKMKADGKWKVKLPQEIRFHDSSISDLIQIADFMSGPIYSKFKYGENFLFDTFVNFYVRENKPYLFTQLKD